MKKNVIQTLAAILFVVLFAALGKTAEQAEPRATIDISGHPYKGPANAPVTVVVFFDYFCGPCKKLEPVLHQVVGKYPKEVKLVPKFLPHSREFSRNAAIAAMAADDQGKFWEFHDKLFENQSVLDDAKVIEIAGMLKMDVKRFEKKRQDSAFEELIDRDLSEAGELEIRGTPQVYINGRVFRQRSVEAFVEAIDKELKR